MELCVCCCYVIVVSGVYLSGGKMNDEEVELELIRIESMIDCAMRELNELKDKIRKGYEHEEMDDSGSNTDSGLRSDQ